MIVDPLRSPEEIDRRLSALEDPQLAELLRAANRDLYTNDDVDGGASPSVPYWKRRVGLLTLAGLIALLTGYASVSSTSHQRERALAPAPPIAPIAAKHRVQAAKPRRHTVIVPHRAAIVHPSVAKPERVAGPNLTSAILERQARAQAAREQAVAAQARADAARAQQRAQIALQAQAQARAQELAQAIAQARAQGRAEAIAQAQAQAKAQAQAQAANDAYDEARLQNGTKPIMVPPNDGGWQSGPTGGGGPVQPGCGGTSCTPCRGTFLSSAVSHVRIGGTSVGTILQLIHHP